MRGKRDKRFEQGTCALGRKLGRKENFHTLGNSLMGGNRGVLQHLKGECSNRCLEGKTNNSPQRSLLTSTSQSGNILHTHNSERGLGAEAQASGVRREKRED